MSLLIVSLLNGTFDITHNGHIFIHRPSVYVPTAVLYYIFGVNYINYSLWPFLCTLGCITLAYKAAHHNKLNAGFAAVFLGFTFYFVYFINFLYPDNIVAFFWLVAATIYFSIYNGDKTRLLLKGIVFTCSLFIAGLAKETALIFLPVFLFFAIRDIFQKDYKPRFWLYSLVTGILLLLVYFGWYYAATGNPFYRIHEMERAILVYDNYVTNTSKSYFRRLVCGPIDALVGTGAFIIVVFSVGGNRLLKGEEIKNKRFWFLLFLTSYLILCFSSTSLKVYNPIRLDARMYNLVIPPLAIAASYGFQKKLSNIKFCLAYTVTFTLAAFYLKNSVGAVYALSALYFALHSICLYLKHKPRHLLPYAALASVTLCLAIRPAYFMLREKTLHYQEHKNIITVLEQHASEAQITSAIVPNYLLSSKNHFLEYKQVSGLKFYSYHDTTTAGKRSLLLVNRSLNSNPSYYGSAPGKALLNAAKQGKLVWKEGPVELYELKTL